MMNVILLSLALWSAPPSASPPLGPVQVRRLAAVCKAWNYAKLAHFSLIEGNVDWDAALVAAVDGVEKASNAAQYRTAVDGMLAQLRDPGTHVVASGNLAGANAYAPNAQTALVNTNGDIYLDVFGVCLSQAYGRSEAADTISRYSGAVDGSKSVILDFRVPSAAAAGLYTLPQLGGNFLSSALKGSWQPAPNSYRVHHGMAADSGMLGSGGYAETIETEVLPAETGQCQAVHPVVAILNENTPNAIVASVLGAHKAGLCKVVCAGDFSAVAGLASQIPLGDGLNAQIRDEIPLGQPLSFDVDGGTDPLAAAKKLIGGGTSADQPPVPQPVFHTQKTSPYYGMNPPTEPYRMLALFRFWGDIDAFSPYKDLIGTSWDDVLTRMIPVFHAATTETEYAKATGLLAASVNDTHCFMIPPVANFLLGTQAPAFGARTIEGRLIVVRSKEPKVHVGDEIVRIDGETPAARGARIAPYIAHATPQALRYLVDSAILASRAPLKLTLKRANGGLIQCEAPVKQVPADSSIPRLTKPIQTLANGRVGYIDLCAVPAQQIPTALASMMKTKALIVDIRGYPQGGGFTLSMELMRKRTTVAQFTEPTWYPLSSAKSSFYTAFGQTFDPMPGPKYDGKIVVLINNSAISQSEHSCLMLEAARKCTFIGTPTMGSNGDVSNVVFPGGFVVYFSGHSVKHADGRQLQRVGIQPDIVVAPTVAGIRAGRDEVLERALRFLGEKPL